MALESKLVLSGGVEVLKAYYVCMLHSTKHYINKVPAATSGVIILTEASETKTRITTLEMSVYKDKNARLNGVPIKTEKCEIGDWMPVGLTDAQLMDSCYDKFCEKQKIENVLV